MSSADNPESNSTSVPEPGREAVIPVELRDVPFRRLTGWGRFPPVVSLGAEVIAWAICDLARASQMTLVAILAVVPLISVVALAVVPRPLREVRAAPDPDATVAVRAPQSAAAAASTKVTVVAVAALVVAYAALVGVTAAGVISISEARDVALLLSPVLAFVGVILSLGRSR